METYSKPQDEKFKKIKEESLASDDCAVFDVATDDLYEGGRAGSRSNVDAYGEADSVYGDFKDQSQKVKHENAIKSAKQLEEQERTQMTRLKNPLITYLIAGLTIKNRNSMLNIFIKRLDENARKSAENLASTFNIMDVENVAIDLEYSIFRKTQTVGDYDSCIASQLRSIKEATKLRALFINFENYERPIKIETVDGKQLVIRF